MKDDRTLHVVGAGPAGLSAAITAARAGVPVVVHEKEETVGKRFHGDFQGLENWTSATDVLDELASLGLDTGFEHTPHTELVCFDPTGRRLSAGSAEPLYYLVRRGPGEGTLDRGLLEQALALGVEVRFGDRVDHLPEGGIVANGPRGVDAIAVGYLFETEAPEGAWVAIDDDLAPGGDAYLLIHGGRGTLATCMFADFHREALHLERTVAHFRAAVGLHMENPRRFSGYGNFELPESAARGGLLTVGEAAGFQDILWGFGLRYAMVSGHLAATAILAGDPARYDGLWRDRFEGLMRAAAVNRFLYAWAGPRVLSWALRRVAAAGDPRAWLHRLYAPAGWKTALHPLVRRRLPSARRHRECLEPGCDCTWCRCQMHDTKPGQDG